MAVSESTLKGIYTVPVVKASGDLPREVFERLRSDARIAWDIETNGLDPNESAIGTCQLFSPSAGACVVTGVKSKPELLSRLLSSAQVTKVFHHAPFDLSFMSQHWGVTVKAAVCTKIASKLIKPDAVAEEHSLRFLVRQYFDIDLDKGMRFSDWMTESLSDEQIEYAVGDVIKLLELHSILQDELRRKGLLPLYEKCCSFIPTHIRLLLHGTPDPFKY